MLFSLRTVAAVGALVATHVYAIPKVTRTGRYLYDEGGNRFYIKGIGYQPQGEVEHGEDNPFGEPNTFIDPLADSAGCQRDAPILQQAGVNAIRVYSVNNTLNHDECMKAFSDAGIYLILDLSIPPDGSIVRDTPSWSTNLLNLYLKTIDAFKGYDNVLAYNVGNEVTTFQAFHTISFVKAAARDVKAYLKSIGSDALVGYSAINGPADFRVAVADFLTCDLSGTNSDATALDLYGLNEYTWCGASSYEGSGYPSAVSQYADFNVVAYFSEYGCIRNPPRRWTEVTELFGPRMTPVWSGGIAFSYFGATSTAGQFGMVAVSDDGTTVTPSADFTALSEQYNAVTPANSPSRDSVAASTYGSCETSAAFMRVSTTIPATPNEEACKCLEDSLSCKFNVPPPGSGDINGQIITSACELLEGLGTPCDGLIGSDSITGTYARVSGCSPAVKASYAMSLYYESQLRNAEACSFAGNGTVNPLATETSAAGAVASSCIANPGEVFVPKLPGSSPSDGGDPSGSPTPSGSSTPPPSGGDGGSDNDDDDDAAVALVSSTGLLGLCLVTSMAALSALWTLI